MDGIKYFVQKHPDLFVYLPADSIHAHDQFVYRIFLKHLPFSITPNCITSLRIFFTPLIFLLILFEHYKVGAAGFLFLAFTDVLDGSLARTQNKITKFGMMYDPLADKFLIGSMVLLLVFRYYNFWLGLGILGLEVAFILLALISKYKFKTVRMANLWGKIKMILQVLAVFATLLGLVMNVPHLFSAAYWLFGLAIGFALVSLFAHGI